MYSDPSIDVKHTQAMSDAYMQVLENRNAQAAKLRAQRGGGTPGMDNLVKGLKASLAPAQATTGAAMKGVAGLASGGSKATNAGGQGNRGRNMTSNVKTPVKPTTGTPAPTTGGSTPKPTPVSTPKPTPTSAPKPTPSASIKTPKFDTSKVSSPTKNFAPKGDPTKGGEFKTRVTDMPTARMNKALSGIGKWSEAYDQWMDEGLS